MEGGIAVSGIAPKFQKGTFLGFFLFFFIFFYFLWSYLRISGSIYKDIGVRRRDGDIALGSGYPSI